MAHAAQIFAIPVTPARIYPLDYVPTELNFGAAVNSQYLLLFAAMGLLAGPNQTTPSGEGSLDFSIDGNPLI